ncbi:hypothetical protein J2S41_000566 [Catenuloplanes atrovinosus]|uniref:Uncharacterized protein n=2 Tax=Catenuloplanes atrovinosus TaxID=137266 RepID=A0AAE3YH28_9ACTN|nr:hypothetical protein [Catenuloplanes atrovinosus]
MIEDLDPRVSRAEIATEVAAMRLGPGSALFARVTPGWLRRRAHTPEQLHELAGRSAFGRAETARYSTIGLRLTLKKETA